jgi:hypothetical protein
MIVRVMPSQKNEADRGGSDQSGARDVWFPIAAIVWTGALLRLIVASCSSEPFTDGVIAALVAFVSLPLLWAPTMRRIWRLRVPPPRRSTP